MITFFSKIKFIIPREEKSRALHIINENYIDFRSISISSSDELIVVPKHFKIKKLEEMILSAKQ